MSVTTRLDLTRAQVLGFRRKVGGLNERLPAGAKSLRQAAWAGLQDSAPRAALLSLHARVDRVRPDTWEHASLVQLWGPRFNDYVVAAKDLGVFSLGRLPLSRAKIARAYEAAERLHRFLDGRRMPFEQAGRAMGVEPNSLRYAAATGKVLLRWEGARQPSVWTVPAPELEPQEARRELARRYLHVLGPGTTESFAKWAGVQPDLANLVFEELAGELAAVRTPVGEAWVLASDEPAFRAKPEAPASVRLLPSGDAFFLAWERERELLVPDAKRRAELWTSRVWPGAILVGGELAGVWRRAAHEVSIDFWRKLTARELHAVEAEAASLPLPGLDRQISVRLGFG